MKEYVGIYIYQNRKSTSIDNLTAYTTQSRASDTNIIYTCLYHLYRPLKHSEVYMRDVNMPRGKISLEGRGQEGNIARDSSFM